MEMYAIIDSAFGLGDEFGEGWELDWGLLGKMRGALGCINCICNTSHNSQY